MKQFLAVYIASPASMEKWQALPEAERKEREQAGVKAWHGWVAQHQADIVQMGAPLGKTKQVSKTGIADIRNALTAFTVAQAENYDAAAKMFENHPHFVFFPGESVEVMECLPIPGM
jgi:hypothetical protein